MKKILFILLLLPFLAFSQSEKRYKSIIIDSVKALSGGSIDVKDSVFFERHVEVDSSFQVNDGQTLLKGVDASTNKFALKVQDNVGTELFNVRNDGKIGIKFDIPDSELHIHRNTAGSVTANASSLLTIENNNTAFINFLTPDNKGSGVLFGIESNNVDGAIQYNNIANPRGFLFSVNGNQTKMTLTSDGKVGIGFSIMPEEALQVVGNILSSNGGDIITRALNPSGGGFLSSGELILRGRFDSDPSGGLTITDFDATIQHIMEDTTPTSRLAFSIDGNEFFSIKESGKIGIGTINPSEKLHVAGNAIIDDTLFIEEIIIHNSLVIKRECSVVVDDGTIVLPDATTQSLLIWVDGDDEWAQCAIQTDGTVTILTSVGSVVNTDTDTNLAIFDSGTGATIKNRLGSSKTVCYETKYKL